MRRVAIAGAIVILLGAGAFTAVQRSRLKHPHSGAEITIPGRDGAGVLLPDGWRVTPAGRQLETGDMILSAAVSPDGKSLAFTNSGYTRHQLHVVDLASEKEIATFPFERAWTGLAWSWNGKKLLVSAGQGNQSADIYTFTHWDDGTVSQGRGVQLSGGSERAKVAVSSIAVSPDGEAVYAVNDLDGYLYILDGRNGETVSRVNLGDHPYAAKLSRDGKRLYVTLLGAAEVVAVDLSDRAQPKVVEHLAVEPHPNDLVITADDRLFVSCGNTNHVVAIDLKTKDKMEAINVAPSPKAPVGSTPNSLALSPDSRELYVADADNNSVAVVSIAHRGQSKVNGFIPTGWYPTVVAATADGKRILIGSGKGLGTGPNHVSRPISKEAAGGFVHHGNNLTGLLSFVDMPDKAKLSEYTKQVIENSPYRDELLLRSGFKGNTVIPTEAGKRSPIEHVLYIIKENRTYDQVFGDIAKGNGDPSLVLYGRDVTPNHHAIAEQFVLLDNLYCNGEVSQDGHPWSTAAYATDFGERAWTLSYSKHGNVNSRATEEQTHPYIWELAKEKGLSTYSFGYTNRRGLSAILSPTFGKNDLPDQQSRMRDYRRGDQFVEEFQRMDRENRIPNFMIMGPGEDHTQGTTPGAFTPKAQVASNDAAIGKIVEAVSKSSVWATSAIFIIEDDAQNGPDHIDSHRTVGLVISPYVKRGYVDSTMYTTVSMLRSMEMLLGMPPMTQHDAAATVMYDSFMTTPDLSTYTAKAAQIDLMTKNTANSFGAAIAAKMDFSDYDRVDEQTLNRILWHDIKGANVPMPAPIRRALAIPHGLLTFPNATAGGDEDER